MAEIPTLFRQECVVQETFLVRDVRGVAVPGAKPPPGLPDWKYSREALLQKKLLEAEDAGDEEEIQRLYAEGAAGEGTIYGWKNKRGEVETRRVLPLRQRRRRGRPRARREAGRRRGKRMRR